jgi:hypothetical protein
MQKNLTIAPKVRQLIKREVGRLMKPFGLIQVEVFASEDHDSDPILVIEAAYELSKRPVDPALITRLTAELREKLWKLGERRFPHVHHRFADGQKVVGYR